MTAPLKIYERIEPAQDEKEKAGKFIAKVMLTKGRLEATAIFLALMLENMRLTAEVNEHRRELGFEPLPEYNL